MKAKVMSQKLTRHLLSGFLTVLFVLVVGSFVINYLSMDIAKKQTLKAYESSLQAVTRQIENHLNNLMRVANIIIADSDFATLEQSNDILSEKMWESIKFKEKLASYSIGNSLKNDMTVLVGGEGRALSVNNGTYIKSEDEYKQLFHQENEGIWYIRNTDNKWNKNQVITYTKKHPLRNQYIVIDIFTEDIQRMLSDIQMSINGDVILVDKNGTTVSSQDMQSDDAKALYKKIMLEDEHTDIIINKDKNTTIIYKKLNVSNLVIFMEFPTNDFLKPIRIIQVLIFALLPLALMFAVIYPLHAYNILLRPVYQLYDGMKEVKKGNFDISLYDEKNHELGFIIKQFNNMVSKINELINKVFVQEIEQKKAEIKLLQAQINPHFLYNSLNYIYQASMSEDNEAAAQMSMFLSKYYRYATKSDVDTVLLIEEIQNVEAYINIHKMRFKNRVSYSIFVEKDIENIKIPRLIIQPIVENAIVHGIEKNNDEGCIQISCKKINNELVITIEDNGKGFDKSIIDTLNKNLERGNRDFGYGVINTHMRLRLRFGENAGVQIIEKNEKGACLILRIPLLERGDHNV